MVNSAAILDLSDRISLFQSQMSDDVMLIFDRITDRINDMNDRVVRLQNKYALILTENSQINAEITSIKNDADVLDSELGQTTAIKNDVVVALTDQFTTNGVYISDRWRLISSGANGHFFIQDLLSNGYYRFLATSSINDVATFA